MKKLLLPLLLIAGIVLSCLKAKDAVEPAGEVNALIGNESFMARFGKEPDAAVPEDLRIKTHLDYVAGILREKDVTQLSAGQKEQRFRMLDLLDEYRNASVFPRNYDHETRKPCFIDKDGRICAVGYLVEKTAGREVAEAINEKYKYAEIFEMNDPAVDSWIAASGLTKEECAMIQPSYGSWPTNPPTDQNNTISKGYGISSSILTGVNLSVNTINLIQSAKGKSSEGLAFTGLVLGAAQTIVGISEFPSDEPGQNTTKERTKSLSMINIGVGTASMILSSWSLISNRKSKEKKVVWGINSFEVNNEPGMALTLVRRL